MHTKHYFVLIVVLLLTAFACSSLPEAPDPNQPPVSRRNGECSDERFETAEEAAYQILLNERADAARAREELITSGERLYRRDLSTANDEYQRALNGCNNDTNCTQTAMQTYNNSVASSQTYQNRRIGVARAEEAAALAAAQAKYDAAVDKAKQLYCEKAYRADGQQQEITYSGLICDLEQPFTVGVTSPYYEFTIQLSPNNSLGGSFTYNGTWYDVGPVSGSGSYTVTYVDGDATLLTLNAQHTTSTEVGDVHGPPQYDFNLTPTDIQACVQP